MEADWLVSAMSLVKLREVPVTPAWPEARQYVVKSFPYYTASRPVFQSRTRFWEKDKVEPEHRPRRARPRALLEHGRRRRDRRAGCSWRRRRA